MCNMVIENYGHVDLDFFCSLWIISTIEDSIGKKDIFIYLSGLLFVNQFLREIRLLNATDM